MSAEWDPTATITQGHVRLPQRVARGASVPDGSSLPPAGRLLPREIDESALAQVLEHLAFHATRAARDLQFSVDQASGRTVITVKEAATGAVVRQIPAEEILAIARHLDSGLPSPWLDISV